MKRLIEIFGLWILEAWAFVVRSYGLLALCVPLVLVQIVDAYAQNCGMGSLQVTSNGVNLTSFEQVCQGGVIEYSLLNASSSPSWSTIPTGAGVFEGGQDTGPTVTVTWVTSGKLRVDYLDTNHTSQCIEINYTVTVFNPGSINGPTTVCYGESFNLTLTGSQNAGGAVWQQCYSNCSNDANWTNVAPLTGSPLPINGLTQNVSFRTKLTHMPCDGSGQIVTLYSPVKNISVNSTAPMSVTIKTNPDPICGPNLASVTISMVASSIIGQNPTYEWYRNGSIVDHNSSQNPQVFDPAKPNYVFQIGEQVQLKVTSGPGCEAWSNLVNIAVVPEVLPVLNGIVRAEPGVCAGKQVTFSINAGGGALNGNWHVGSGGFPLTTAYYSLNVDDVVGQAVHFSTQLTGSCGTQQSATASTGIINLDPAPNVVAQDDEICVGETATITLGSTLQNTSFTWIVAHDNTTTSASNGSGSTISQMIELLSPSQNGVATFAVTPTSQVGCVGQSRDVHAYVFANPANPSITNADVCDFENVVLSAGLTANISDYNWFNAQDVLIGKGPRVALSALPSGTHTFKVQAISSKGCSGNGPSQFTVNVSSSCDDKLNWIESTAYSTSESDPYSPVVVAQGKSYFDLSGAPLQTQARNLTRNDILSAATIADKFGRISATSLSAPLNLTAFQYRHWFARTITGALLDHNNIGVALGSQPGSVGRYYSSSNANEQHVPISGYPFSRTDYYDDGTGQVKRAVAPGEAFWLNPEDHNVLTGSFPVYHELDDYVQKRRLALPGIDDDGSLYEEGVQTVTRDQHGRYSVNITDKTGKSVVSCLKGSSTKHDLAVTTTLTSSSDPGSPHYRPLTYFYILNDQAVSISVGADYTIEDIVAGETYVPPGNGEWKAGFYRIVLRSGSITIGFANHYSDVSYQLYDDAGRIRSSISPNGYRQLKDVSYALIDKTTYRYNHRGWLLSMTEPDAGETQYVYRKDGKIRFSQNALQRINGRFSYTHYDGIGRPVESGEYVGIDLTFIPMYDASFSQSSISNELEKSYDQITWAENDKNDWTITYYDVAPPDGIPLSLQQEFTRGAVSSSKNPYNQTWYSYDEFGRVKWMVQQPKDLPITPVLRYTYDFAGNVLQVENATYQSGTLVSQFFHHYEYDADLRLSKASTSTDGNSTTLRATYEYYLHGPLKRIELGDKLQGIDFVYNINGWLTQINHPDTDADPGRDGLDGDHSGVRKDVFGMVLDYYESSLNNLYSATTGVATPNINLIHGLPTQGRSLVSSQPLIRFSPLNDSATGAPGNGTMKAFSAENIRLHDMIMKNQEQQRNMITIGN